MTFTIKHEISIYVLTSADYLRTSVETLNGAWKYWITLSMFKLHNYWQAIIYIITVHSATTTSPGQFDKLPYHSSSLCWKDDGLAPLHGQNFTSGIKDFHSCWMCDVMYTEKDFLLRVLPWSAVIFLSSFFSPVLRLEYVG